MKILTCYWREFDALKNIVEYDYIILVNHSFPWVGHKCIRPQVITKGNNSHFRFHSTKHCKVCHKTWPKEVQITVNLVGN